MIRKAMAEREAGADKARRQEENEDPQKSVEDVKGHIEDI